MHDHRQPAGQCDNGLLLTAPLGNVHRPSLEPRPSGRSNQHCLCGLVEKGSHHGVAALGDPADAAILARLVENRRQSQHRTDCLRVPEACRNVDGGGIGQRHDGADARDCRQPTAYTIIPHDRQQLAVQSREMLTAAARREEARRSRSVPQYLQGVHECAVRTGPYQQLQL
jgi:hypothetical protein